MAVFSKGHNPDNFESHNSKTSFTNIEDLHLNFVESNLDETNLDDSNNSGNFFVRGYLTLIRKDIVTYMHGLAVYVKTDFHLHRVFL